MFNTSNKIWTWLTGNTTINPVGIYGNRGVAAVDNVPGMRCFHSMGIDSANQVIYVFGGWFNIITEMGNIMSVHKCESFHALIDLHRVFE